MKVRECCPACGAVEKEQCFIVNGYDIKRCVDCGTLYVERLPTEKELAAIYTSDSYYALSTESMQRIADENTRRLSLICQMKPKGNFLDIGCAHGLLLDQAKQRGYDTFGVEPTSKNAEVASAKGHRVFNGWLKDFVSKNDGQLFDVVTCLDVIEHIDHPKPFLELAASLLAVDGLMVVSTPNYSGVIAKALGARDPYMTPPEHITFFTVNGMRRLAQRCGLATHSVKSFGSLVPAEMDRAIQRYIPKPMQVLAPLIHPPVHFAFWTMNRMSVGLEQEIYLTKTS